MKTYSVGDIVRLGLLKNHLGRPYKHKGSVLKLLKGERRVRTPWGMGYAITPKQIAKLNARWK